MEKFAAWWKQDKRYVTLAKAVLLGALPLLCCLVYCAMQGKTIGQVYLPESEWNDELFYYKQVEGIVHFGYPLGYFGFNESHALKLSFAAWSPALVFPWIIWGLLFGWNLMSPVICNIFLMTLCCFLFVWLVRPTWKQLGILGLLFCFYTPFVRYMLSTMPEVICFSMLILFYGLAMNYLKKEKTYKLILLFVLAGVMTLMRPYLLLFLLLPVFLRIRKGGWSGALGSAGVLTVVLGAYACIKHYLGAEYFAPLFFTDWVEAFFEQGLFGGIHYTLSKLYYMGRDFMNHTVQGFRTGLASGAFFAGYLVMLAVLLWQSVADWRKLRREKARSAEGTDGGITAETSKQRGRDNAGRREIYNRLVIEAHLAFSFVGMLFALLLMYKLTEGSKHLLTFMAAGIFVIAMMETRFYKKAVLIGVTFAYFYSYMAVDPYDYQAPFVREERQTQIETWRDIFADTISLEKEDTPRFDNVVIWVFSDVTEQERRDAADGQGETDGQNAADGQDVPDGQDAADGQDVTDGQNVPDGQDVTDGQNGAAAPHTQNTAWQVLYALPEGCGISCCMRDYVIENLDSLESRYLLTVSGGEIDALCGQAGYEELGRDDEVVFYQRY